MTDSKEERKPTSTGLGQFKIGDKKFCDCGCGKEIIIKWHHKYYGIPKFMVGHGKKSEQTILKRIATNKLKGNPHWDAERRLNMSRIMANKKRVPQTKEVILKKIESRKKNNNFIYSEETKLKLRNAQL